MLEHALTGEGHRVAAVGDAETARELLASETFDLVLTDLKLPGGSGLDVVKSARRRQPDAPVIVLTAFGTVATAVEAMKLGATDFLEKPVEIEDLFALVDAALTRPAEPSSFSTPGGTTIVGSHPHLRAALRLLERVAPTDSTVLLTGESGTGKELFARALHDLSQRSGGPFVAVNCAAIPASLVESELFGHEKGAFTGAHRTRAGRFERASGGTLLLDEIGDLDLTVQSKVLRVLEEKTYERVGGESSRRSDVRLVAATNRDLAAMAEAGEFRSDLRFRLDVFPIELPPLRDRIADLPELAAHLLAKLATRHSRSPARLSESALRRLEEQPWPGNVRQLANVLERALILSNGDVLGEELFDALPEQPDEAEERERRQLESALVAARGDKHEAARALGVSYRTLLRRVARHRLEGVGRYVDP